ncbi:MAG TPA: hypothetical protein DCG53_02420 [Syntrophus sp. (in: bacteria)]|jgi:hypothetical protein|nr:hypothetical protein [Syntrophus sp. (in: bacteria)]
MPIQNPYGAVPEALTQTRLSLRDIMADMLLTKKMEQDLSLAKSKAETETAIVGANIERDRLVNTKDMASLEETTRAHRANEQNAADTLSLHQQGQDFIQNVQFPSEMALKEKNLESEIPVRQAHAASLRAAATATMNEEKRKNEIVSAKDFASRMGAGHMLPVLGIDPNDKRPAYQWEALGQSFKSMMTQHPAIGIVSQGYRLKSEMADLSSQYNTPGLAPEAKAALKTQIGQRLNQLQTIDEMIMQIKEPDSTKIAESARKVWAENPQFQTQFKNYEDFHTNYAAEVKKTRSIFHDDMKAMKFNLATRDIDPDYVGTMKTARETIQKLADKKLATQIDIGRKARLEKGDLAGAYKYQTDWANYLLAKKGGNSSPTPDQSSVLTPLNRQSENASENWDRSMRSGLSTLADVAKAMGKSATGKIGEAYIK